jgi:hypothetical protein
VDIDFISWEETEIREDGREYIIMMHAVAVVEQPSARTVCDLFPVDRDHLISRDFSGLPQCEECKAELRQRGW